MIDLAGAVTSGRATNGHVRFLHLVHCIVPLNGYIVNMEPCTGHGTLET